MVYHVLNGDALLERFRATGLPGQVVINRECLIEGELEANSLSQFWQIRARHIEATYFESQEKYFSHVVEEFRKLMAAPQSSEFNLWFGHDLFCQTNMWFTLSLLHNLPIHKTIYAVYPVVAEGQDAWEEFGRSTSNDLHKAFLARIAFGEKDITLSKDLWNDYRTRDFTSLIKLSHQNSPCFERLSEICRAHIERFPSNGERSRPEKVVADIVNHSRDDFQGVFLEFSKREGIYGFSDLQVKKIYEKMTSHV